MSQGTVQGAPAKPSDENGRADVDRAADGEKLKPSEEKGALDFLLGAPAPARYTVKIEIDTDGGRKPLTLHLRAIDGRVIDQIEQKYIDDRTGKIDRIGADVEIVAKTCEFIEDETGAKVEPRSEQFRTIKVEDGALGSTADAFMVRFSSQLGLLSGVAREIKVAMGWDVERVAAASRVLVAAAEN